MNPWDERYSIASFYYGTEPNDFLREHAEGVLGIKSQKKVLCLADGEGRNSVYLAQLGADATAIDISEVGLAKAKQLANERAVQIKTEVADLSAHTLAESEYDAIVMIFCHLPAAARPHLYQQIRRALKPNGWLLVEGYNDQQLGRGTGGPPSLDLMINLTELEQEFADYRVYHAKNVVRTIIEGEGHSGDGAVAQFIAQKPSA